MDIAFALFVQRMSTYNLITLFFFNIGTIRRNLRGWTFDFFYNVLSYKRFYNCSLTLSRNLNGIRRIGCAIGGCALLIGNVN